MNEAVIHNSVRDFRDLIVWQKAMACSIAVYKLVATFPSNEAYGLVSQMKRAAVSIPSNISEGHGRGGTKEYLHFVGIARGSLNELLTHLLIARELNMGAEEKSIAIEKQVEELLRLTNALRASLQAKVLAKP